MNKRIQRTFWALVLSGGLLASTGCVGVGYGGGSAYDYNYYPDSDVYFYPHGHTYFWNEQGNWRSGERLPDRYDVTHHTSQQLHLHTKQPWTEHHPAGRDEKH